jgi:hypothetical protein
MLRAGIWVLFSFGQAATSSSVWPIIPNALVAGAMVTLLLGTAGKARVIVGCVLIGLFALLEIAAVLMSFA